MLIRGVAAFWLTGFLWMGADSSLRAEPSAEWIRGTGKDLEIRLRGTVLGADNSKLTGISVTGGINAMGVSHPLAPAVDGNQFELWIRVNQRRWHSMWLRAASEDGSLVQYKRMNMFELRQAAIDGLEFTLQKPTRQLKVKVTQHGEVVADAWVKADLGYGIELRRRTGIDGTAVFGLLPMQEPNRLTAWTEDFRVGGFSFSRKPTRDPNADEHEVELSACRDQRLRFVDLDGAPVPNVTFVLQMATLPNYNFIGTNEHSHQTTDENGEVMYRWFPDWEKHFYYPSLQTVQWIRDGDPEIVNGVAIVTLKRGADRKRVTGRAVVQDQDDAGGFFVTLRSFQGERENESDVLSTFTDPDGSFTVDVLPDATYCAWTLDSNWVGEVTHLIPYQTLGKKVTPPELAVLKGQRVKVIATTGKTKKPYANLGISFRREHRYSWREDGRTRNGTGGPQWWARTDADGIATTNALPGHITASVYTPMWRQEAKVDVSLGEPAIIRLHREVDEKRTVTGRVVLAKGVDSSVDGAVVKVGSIDGDTDDEQELIVGTDGSFSFQTLSTEIGMFATTADGRAAGALTVKELDSPIALELRPTVEYRGQLLGDADKPLRGHDVWATVRVSGEVDYSKRATFSTSFEAMRIETKTDPQGNYVIRRLPVGMKVNLRADAIDGSDRTEYLDEVYLQLDESRPVAVSRLSTGKDTVKISLAERVERTLRDCSLMGFRLMIVTSADDESMTEFVDENFVDYGKNQDVSTFMQIVLAGSAESLPSADLAFLNERKWLLAGDSRVFACAIDAQGNELGRLELEINEKGAADKAADFIQLHAPKKLDAEKKWNEAFEDAKNSKRKVWARVSQRYCGPCFRMARWLDDNRELLAKDYVMLKIDDVRDRHGVPVARRLTRGVHHGVPFHAIFDDRQKVVIDSAGPLGNIGHPSGFEGKKHLRRMLLETSRNLTDEEIDQIVESLDG